LGLSYGETLGETLDGGLLAGRGGWAGDGIHVGMKREAEQGSRGDSV
jgi:hypothetical protein